MIEEREWDIIALTGLTFNNRFAPFAIAFLEVSEERIANIAQVIANFFKRMGDQPKTIITPSDEFYKNILVILRQKTAFQGTHLIDGIE